MVKNISKGGGEKETEEDEKGKGMAQGEGKFEMGGECQEEQENTKGKTKS